MKITEIISHLGAILAEEGDLEAITYTGFVDDRITDIEVDVRADGKWVWIG